MKARSLLLALACLAVLLGLASCARWNDASVPEPQPEDGYTRVSFSAVSAVAALEATIRYDGTALEFVGFEAPEQVLVATAHERDLLRLVAISSTDVESGFVEVVLRRRGAGDGDLVVVDARVYERSGTHLPGAIEVEVAEGRGPAMLVNGYERARGMSRSLLQDGIRVLSSDPMELEAWFADFPLGDVTQSGGVDVIDALRILDVATGSEPTPPAFARYHGDLDSSGLVNVVDVLIALEKVVDPQRAARLEVAPRVLNLRADTNGVILIGNSGNAPLPEIDLTPPDGIILTEVSSGTAVGRAFQAWASQATDQSLLVDADTAGQFELVMAIDGYVEIVATESLMLTGVGSTTTLTGVVYESDGTVNPDAVVEWSSSDPTSLSIDASGTLKAEIEAGSAMLSARSGALVATVFAGVVELATESTLVDRYEVLTIEPDTEDRSLVTLSKSRTYTVGEIVVSEAGLLSRILSLTDEGTHYLAVVESVELSEAFEQISISGASAPLSYSATVSSSGVSVTSSDPRIAPQGKFNLLGLDCVTESGASIEPSVEWGSIDISYRPTIHFEYVRERASNTQLLRMYVSDTPTLYMAPSVLTVDAEVEGKIVCSKQIAPKLDIAIATFWGIVTVNGSFTPKVGFQAEARAWGELTVITPSVTAGIDIREVGVQYDATAGLWSILSDTRPFFELGELSTNIDTEFTASVGPFLSLGAGVSIKVLVDAVGIDFLEPNIYGKLDLELVDPLLRNQRGYTGPRWDAEIGSVAKVKVEVTGIVAKVLKYFGVRTSFADDEYQLFRYPIDASPSIAVTTFAAGNSVFFTATVAPTRLSYVGRKVEFWVFEDGAEFAVRKAEATLDASRVASATWFASSADLGTYEVVALLNDRVFGAILLPYPSGLASFVLPGADTGAQVIAPRASTCAGVGVGATCTVTIDLSDNEDTLLGMQFDISTPGFSFAQGETVGLIQGCEIDASPAYGRIAIVCLDGVTGDGDIARVQLSRMSSAASTFTTSRAFITNEAWLERPAAGGELNVP